MTVLQRINDLRDLSIDCRRSRLSIGLCHGCFDIVHLGHIHHLRQARSMVDRLIVSVTADKFVNKGPDRPIFPDNVRAELIAAISYCDHAIVSHAATAELVISALRPNVFFKGGDYLTSKDTRVGMEKDVVERNGGRLVLTDALVMDSTSRIAEIILSGHGATAER
jgi:rfaE bifunctional protein nucleotidyltransferase chain/domain